MYCIYGGLPAAVRLFFRHRDGVFLRQHHAAPDAGGEGEQKRGAESEAAGAVRPAAVHHPHRQQHRQYRHRVHRHGAVRAALRRCGRHHLHGGGDGGGADLRRDIPQEHRQGLRGEVRHAVRPHPAGAHLGADAPESAVLPVEKAAEQGFPPQRRKQDVPGGAADAGGRGAAGGQHRPGRGRAAEKRHRLFRAGGPGHPDPPGGSGGAARHRRQGGGSRAVHPDQVLPAAGLRRLHRPYSGHRPPEGLLCGLRRDG